MATAEMAAMLDALMGRNRNNLPTDKIERMSWENRDACPSYMCQFCPHDLFTNTKADFGPCPNIHDEDLREGYREAPADHRRKLECQEDFLRFGQRLINEVDSKIRRGKERLVSDQVEKMAQFGITPQQQEENEEKINILTDKINGLVDQAEQAGNQGDVEEAQGLLKLCDQLKTERDDLKAQVGFFKVPTLKNPVPGPDYGYAPKEMEVCEICGAFLIKGDAQSRVDDHLMGKLHVGYAKLRVTVDTMIDERRREREEKEKEREVEREERRKRREEEDKLKEEKEKEKKSRDGKSRDRSRDRKRSRSRDRRRGARSRDRRDRKKESRERSRDRRDGKRGSRERSRDRRDRSRDRNRDKGRDHRRNRSRSVDRSDRY